MIAFNILKNVKRLLCIGAHSDDIEIGAGTTVLRVVRESPEVEITWCVLSGSPTRHDEARRAAERLLGSSIKSLILTSIPNSQFPEHRRQIKQIFEEHLKAAKPDLILTHSREDRHQDHRVANEFTWNTSELTRFGNMKFPNGTAT